MRWSRLVFLAALSPDTGFRRHWNQIPAASLPKLEHFVELIRERLSALDFETKRMALEMLDIKVWIDGDNVEVTGVVPISDYVIATPGMGY